MKILFVHSPADLYGASRSLLRLSSRLASDGHHPIAVLPQEGQLAGELRRAGVAVELDRGLTAIDRKVLHPRGLASLLGRMPLSVARIVGLIRKHRADIVHTNTSLILSPAIAAAICRVPHVWHIRESFSEFGCSWRTHQRLMSRLSARILAVSEAVAEQFDPPVRRRKVAVLHNGFPQAEFDGVTGERVEEFRRRFGLNGGPAAGVVGRIKLLRKGQDTFVRAVAGIKHRFPSARFLLVGSPFPGNETHLQSLNQLIHDLGVDDVVACTGDVEDIKAAYSALDFTVLPASLPEPFGGVVIESMAMGKPVIGTRLGGTREQIDDGVTGLLINPDSPEELASAMERLLSDPGERARMGAAARARFLEHFEFEPFYRRMLDIYREVQRNAKGIS